MSISLQCSMCLANAKDTSCWYRIPLTIESSNNNLNSSNNLNLQPNPTNLPFAGASDGFTEDVARTIFANTLLLFVKCSTEMIGSGSCCCCWSSPFFLPDFNVRRKIVCPKKNKPNMVEEERYRNRAAVRCHAPP